MKEVQDRVVQFSNRYKLTDVATGEVLGTFDFDEVTGTVQQVGTEIDAELFDSIANDLAARVKLSGGELAETVVTFSNISGTASNVASGDTSATLWGKVKNWFSRLKALAFKNKVAAGDFEAGAIKNADVAADAAIAQSKVSGLMTDYVASISVSGRTVTYKNKNGVDMGSITTQDTTYGLASQSSNGLMSSTDKTKLDGIESGAQKNTVLGVKGGSESAYRTGNVNITKANIGLGNVDNTSDEDKPVSTATQTALNGKANTNGTYPNLTVGTATNADNATNATKATQDANGNVIDETYATKTELVEATGTKVKVNGTTQPEVNFTSDPQTQITANKTAIAEAQSDISDIVSGAQTVGKATTADSATNAEDAAKLGGVAAENYATNAALQAATTFSGTCSTVASTSSKTVSITGFTSSNLVNGTRITVTFTYNNTSSVPTLNVSGTGAKNIVTQTGAELTGTVGDWKAGSTLTFVYWNNEWVLQSPTLNATVNGAEYFAGAPEPTFYAPTSAGTAGYVLTSNGVGAPVWTNPAKYSTQVVNLGAGGNFLSRTIYRINNGALSIFTGIIETPASGTVEGELGTEFASGAIALTAPTGNVGELGIYFPADDRSKVALTSRNASGGQSSFVCVIGVEV